MSLFVVSGHGAFINGNVNSAASVMTREFFANGCVINIYSMYEGLFQNKRKDIQGMSRQKAGQCLCAVPSPLLHPGKGYIKFVWNSAPMSLMDMSDLCVA
jgi:hypothetical protein